MVPTEQKTSIKPVPPTPEVVHALGLLWAERVWKVLIIGGLFVWLWWPEIYRLLQTWSTPDESHGILIPLFSVYFLYQRRRQIAQVRGRVNVLGMAVIVASLAGYLLFTAVGFAYPSSLMMIIMLAGVVLFLGGWPVFRHAWLPVMFLLFAVPLPQYLHDGLTIPMRQLASQVGAMILNALPAVDCQAIGVVIDGNHGGKVFTLEVAEACSGMRLLRAFVALGVAMAYLEPRPMWQRLILVASTVPIAILVNVVRVVLSGLISIYIGREYAEGTPHELLGLGMLVVAFGLYGLLAMMMNRLFVEEEEETQGVLVVGEGRASVE